MWGSELRRPATYRHIPHPTYLWCQDGKDFVIYLKLMLRERKNVPMQPLMLCYFRNIVSFGKTLNIIGTRVRKAQSLPKVNYG
jgi:hypothetical protein